MDIGFVLALLVMGLVVGLLARFLLPGRDRMSFGATLLLGVVGSIIGGVLARYVFDADGGAEFVLALVSAMVLLLLLRSTRRSRRGVI